MRRSFVLMLAALAATAAMTAAVAAAATSVPGAVAGTRATMTAGAGSISGLVTAKDSGTPLDGICVDLFMLTGGDASNANDWLDVGTVYRTLSGSYSFPGLAAGTYVLKLTEGTGAANPVFTDGIGAYAQQYWNDKRTLTSADRIVLATGESRTVDVQLPKAGHIRGIVTNEAGEPLAGINIAVRPTDLSVDEVSQGIYLTGADGSYDIGGLNTGQYQLNAVDNSATPVYLWQIFGGGHDQSKATPIPVTLGQATTQNLTMQRAATISGTISTRLGVLPADVNCEAQAQAPNGSWNTLSGSVLDSHLLTRTSCAYTIEQVPPGRYRIRFWWPEHPQNAKYYPGTFDAAQAERVNVAEGQALTGIDAVVWGDTSAPTTQAPDPVVVAAAPAAAISTSEALRTATGSRGVFLYRVLDKGPHGPTASVTIKIKTLAGKTVSVIALGRRSVNHWHSCHLTAVHLAKGRYRYVVDAVDSGGNHQRRAGGNSLVVK